MVSQVKKTTKIKAEIKRTEFVKIRLTPREKQELLDFLGDESSISDFIRNAYKKEMVQV